MARLHFSDPTRRNIAASGDWFSRLVELGGRGIRSAIGNNESVVVFPKGFDYSSGVLDIADVEYHIHARRTEGGHSSPFVVDCDAEGISGGEGKRGKGKEGRTKERERGNLASAQKVWTLKETRTRWHSGC